MDRETFFPNDQPHLVYEVRRPSLSRFDDPDGVPAEPTDVVVRIFNATTGEMVLIDGFADFDLLSAYIDMTPMNEATDTGAMIEIIVPPEVASEPGNYTLYISTEFVDGLRITTDQRVQISEYR